MSARITCNGGSGGATGVRKTRVGVERERERRRGRERGQLLVSVRTGSLNFLVTQ